MELHTNNSYRWKGSVYRLIWFELIVFIGIYAVISIIYRYLLTETMKIYFEWFCIYCNKYNETIPVAFVLGFYVSLVVSRWWEQFMTLPWPDQMALYLTAYCHGNEDRPTMFRRTIMRYLNLSYCIALRSISSRARLRFPTVEHLVTSGLMTKEELDLYRNTQPIEYPLYYLPLIWALTLISKAREEGFIRHNRAIKIMNEEVNNFRGKLGIIFAYDWINLPLVYTQMATIAVYSYFISCLMAWQYLDPSKNYPNYDIDIYVPVFGLLRFFFYMGWLKVAESLINPFGEDVDDFEIEYLIERNLQVSYLIVDGMNHDQPDLVQDPFWDTAFDISQSGWIKGKECQVDADGNPLAPTSEGDPFIGSLANLEISERRSSVAFWHGSQLLRRRSSVQTPCKSPDEEV